MDRDVVERATEAAEELRCYDVCQSAECGKDRTAAADVLDEAIAAIRELREQEKGAVARAEVLFLSGADFQSEIVKLRQQRDTAHAAVGVLRAECMAWRNHPTIAEPPKTEAEGRDLLVRVRACAVARAATDSLQALTAPEVKR